MEVEKRYEDSSPVTAPADRKYCSVFIDLLTTNRYAYTDVFPTIYSDPFNERKKLTRSQI